MKLELITLIALLAYTGAYELTFELPDSERMCFYEVIKRNTSCVLEFQVITGGNYDVDLELRSRSEGRTIYKETKKQFDTVTFSSGSALEEEEFEFCFSNEFSTFTHKLVYFDFVVGEDDPLRNALGNHVTALTLMEVATENIRESMNTVIDHQTHHRLRESQGKAFADDLSDRVLFWSVGQSLVILVVMIGQVMVLRSFFSDRGVGSSNGRAKHRLGN